MSTLLNKPGLTSTYEEEIVLDQIELESLGI